MNKKFIGCEFSGSAAHQFLFSGEPHHQIQITVVIRAGACAWLRVHEYAFDANGIRDFFLWEEHK